jgi:hypothetical protein
MQAMLRESRYTEVMTRWARVWMGMAVLYFLMCLAKSLLLWFWDTEEDRRDHRPYFAVWGAGFLGTLALAWFFRLWRGPRLSHVERQLAQVWGIFWVGFFLTAWLYHRAGARIEFLLPILVMEGAVALGCMATILGGSFYLMAAACVVTAVLEAVWPEPGPLISAVIFCPALFWLGWKYWRLGRG